MRSTKSFLSNPKRTVRGHEELRGCVITKRKPRDYFPQSTMTELEKNTHNFMSKKIADLTEATAN